MAVLAYRLAFAVTLSSLLFGCHRTSAASSTASTLDPVDFYPLTIGNAWSYDVDTGEPSTTLAITRVEKREGRQVQLRTAKTVVRYEIRAEGIHVPGEDAWLMRAPLRSGMQWRARGGRTAVILSVDAVESTPAGRFEGCIDVLERGGELGLEVRTIYCPGVGPVRLVSTLRSAETGRTWTVSARLRGYRVSPEPGGLE